MAGERPPTPLSNHSEADIRSPVRAFTLVELLFSGGLALLCLGVLAAMFVPSVLLFKQQSSLAQAQQEGSVLMDRLRSGIFTTLPETISVPASGQALSWRPGDKNSPFNSAGNPNLLGHFDVYAWDVPLKELRYTDWVPTGFDFTQITALPTTQFPSGMTPKTRVVARHVTLFRVTTPVSYPLEIELTINPPSPKGNSSWTLTQKIMPPGGLAPQ